MDSDSDKYDLIRHYLIMLTTQTKYLHIIYTYRDIWYLYIYYEFVSDLDAQLPSNYKNWKYYNNLWISFCKYIFTPIFQSVYRAMYITEWRNFH